jgi:hypothetical protein
VVAGGLIGVEGGIRDVRENQFRETLTPQHPDVVEGWFKFCSAVSIFQSTQLKSGGFPLPRCPASTTHPHRRGLHVSRGHGSRSARTLLAHHRLGFLCESRAAFRADPRLPCSPPLGSLRRSSRLPIPY